MTYKFTPGEYKTRDGRKAVVLADDAPGDCPLVGYYLHKDGHSSASSWGRDGIWVQGCPGEPQDLMPPVTEPEQVVRWVNLYTRPFVGHMVSGQQFYVSREAASANQNALGAGFTYAGSCRVSINPSGDFCGAVIHDENTPSEYDRGWNEALEAAEAKFVAAGFEDDGLVIPHVRALKRSAP